MPAMPETPPLTPDLVLAEARALASGYAADTERRLSGLRLLYRAYPALFTPEVLQLLKEAGASSKSAADTRALAVLKESFGYDAFRPGQLEIIRAALAGRDCLGVMPTGAGKSVTYQVPARLLGGVTLVVSPLISLMKDQVDAMTEVGIRATFLNSSLEPNERDKRVAKLRKGEYELLYAAPEGIDASVGRLLEGLNLRLIAVDEAHCISEWGHDFRPSYRNLAGLKARFRGLPILALTATATPRVKSDIIAQLAMQNPVEVHGSFFRPNLHLYSVKKGDREGVRDMILRLVRSRRGDAGIVYCLSRKAAESTAEFLESKGVRAAPYHAGLAPEKRAKTQEAFSRDDLDVVCATIAFGMGIDKSNVRFVLHRDMPRSVEGYYQEIGRAGRDGAPADCVLFYSWADVKSLEGMLDPSADPEVSAQQLRAVRRMFDLADGRACLWRRLAGHFAESIDACETSCGCCTGKDIVGEARAAGLKAKDGPKKKTRRARSEDEGFERPAPEPSEEPVPEPTESNPNPALFERLRVLRRKLADERKVPAFVVFSDKTLQDMAGRRPQSRDEFLEVHGVGQRKLEEYGDAFLEELRKS